MNTMIIAWFELKRMATSRTVLINQFCCRSFLFYIGKCALGLVRQRSGI